LPVGGVHDPGTPRQVQAAGIPTCRQPCPRTYRWRRCRNGAFSTIVGPVAEKEAAMDRSPSLAEIGVALPGVVGAAVRRTLEGTGRLWAP